MHAWALLSAAAHLTIRNVLCALFVPQRAEISAVSPSQLSVILLKALAHVVLMFVPETLSVDPSALIY